MKPSFVTLLCILIQARAFGQVTANAISYSDLPYLTQLDQGWMSEGITEASIEPIAAFSTDQTAFLSYHVTGSGTSIRILVTNAQGKVIKEFDSEPSGILTVFAHTLSPGSYQCSIVESGRILFSRSFKVFSR